MEKKRKKSENMLEKDKDYKIEESVKTKINTKENKRKNSTVSTNDSNNKKVEKSKKKPTVEDDDSDFDIDPQKIKAKLNLNIDPSILAKNNQPFRRIKEEDIQIKDKKLTNNSWDYYAKLSGNENATHANEKLKVTAGKDFKKEKTKFKNKSGFGGNIVTTEIKSIKLCEDSDSD